MRIIRLIVKSIKLKDLNKKELTYNNQCFLIKQELSVHFMPTAPYLVC